MSFTEDFERFLTALPKSAVFSNPARELTFKAPSIALEKQTVFGLNIFEWQHPDPKNNTNRLFEWIHNPVIPELPTEVHKWLLNSSTVQNNDALCFRYFLWLLTDVLGELNALDKHCGLTITNERMLIKINDVNLGWNHNRWGVWTDIALNSYQNKSSVSPIKCLKSFQNSPVNLRDEWTHDLYVYCVSAFPLILHKPDVKQNFLNVLEIARVLFPGKNTSYRLWRR